MTRRDMNRKIRRIKAHLKRLGVILALVLAVVLMICGCLYIVEHVFQSDKKTNGERNNDVVTSSDDVQADQPSEEVPDDIETQILNTYNYQYSKPDASGLHIVLDAGHGGNDGGTQAGDIIEKDVNLTITKKLEALLIEAGATVTMTRDKDDYVALKDRTAIGNQSNADLFLSLHCNSFESDSNVHGLEIYYHKNSETSKQYAETATQALKDSNTIYVREVSKQNMEVLRNSSIPAIMIEMGFLTNAEDCANLNDSLYQEFLTRLIAEKIITML